MTLLGLENSTLRPIRDPNQIGGRRVLLLICFPTVAVLFQPALYPSMYTGTDNGSPSTFILGLTIPGSLPSRTIPLMVTLWSTQLG